MLLARQGRIVCHQRNLNYCLKGSKGSLRACSRISRQRAANMSSSTAEASTSYEQSVMGSVLGAMCGDALGASVEGWTAETIQSAFPGGLMTFQDTERG
jgi:hypothetical protein